MTAMVAALRVPKVRWGIGVLLGAGTFTSAALDTDDTFSHTYSAPGEYPYICTIHPYMVGKIIVKPGGKSS